MKKVTSRFILFFFILILLLFSLYFFFAFYYQNGFSYGTYINGVYCTGKTIEEVNDELNQKMNDDELIITIDGEKQYHILFDSISYTHDYTVPLTSYLKKQNPYLWIENLFFASEGITIHPTGTFSEDQLINQLKQIPAFSFDTEKAAVLLDKTTENGFILKDSKKNILNQDKAFNVIKNALENGDFFINLKEHNCYYSLSYTPKEQKILQLFQKISAFQGKKVCYQFGEESEILTSGQLADIMQLDSEEKTPLLDASDRISVDREKLKALLTEVFAPYNTYKNHTFLTHDQQSVLITGGTYGNQIDLSGEEELLFSFLQNDEENLTRIPKYLHEVEKKGSDDIGSTYIEISLDEQKLFYYKNSSLLLETDVVTGNVKRNRETPQMVCTVYGKQTRRILKGPGYSSFVNFWLPVSGNIGIHDASWRNEYGNDIYLTAGSHGCINTPYDTMKELYEEVEIGTPVIIYKLDDKK